MESLWKLTYLLEPASLALIATAISVAYASASRALDYGKEMERNLDFSEASITLDRSQALMIPLASSCSLLLMFYLFSSVPHLVTAFTTVASVMALFFCLCPYTTYLKTRFNLMDPFVSRCCSKSFTRLQAFVSHVRLPNIKICALLLVCLFVYDIFWVFFSERFFGANVMVSVATQKASNPVHTVANKLSLPGLQLITKKLELPVKLVFPRNLLGGIVPGSSPGDYMMLGLGDMAIPGMLLALVLFFDNRKHKDANVPSDVSPSKRRNYVYCALTGYGVGLVAALAAGILSQSPQPALLYLVPSTLGPVMYLSWLRNELWELWEGSGPILNEKARLLEV
ncbi:unnamed protein product [Urochloa humidicola]